MVTQDIMHMVTYNMRTHAHITLFSLTHTPSLQRSAAAAAAAGGGGGGGGGSNNSNYFHSHGGGQQTHDSVQR